MKRDEIAPNCVCVGGWVAHRKTDTLSWLIYTYLPV